MGMELAVAPEGAFYTFPSLSKLPEALQNGMDFFQAALEKQVIVVPGVFFDVNPGKRRSHLPSRLRNYVRISFGPHIDTVALGLSRLEELISEHR